MKANCGLEVLVKNFEELHFQAGVVVRLPLFGLSYWLDRTWFRLKKRKLRLGKVNKLSRRDNITKRLEDRRDIDTEG